VTSSTKASGGEDGKAPKTVSFSNTVDLTAEATATDRRLP
jgi:hypothetical protein